MARVLAAEVGLREVWAWSMYDFANSAYTTVVVIFVALIMTIVGLLDLGFAKAMFAVFGKNQ